MSDPSSADSTETVDDVKPLEEGGQGDKGTGGQGEGETAQDAVPVAGPSVFESFPEYRCHKKVRAVQILSMGLEGEDSHQVIIPAHPELPTIAVTEEWVAKHAPKAGGYLVVYEDGYLSYSPAKAFEEGYALISAVGTEVPAAGVDAKADELEELLRDPAVIWYGPHPCEVCGETVVRASEEDDGFTLEAADHNHHYPNFPWKLHECSGIPKEPDLPVSPSPMPLVAPAADVAPEERTAQDNGPVVLPFARLRFRLDSARSSGESVSLELRAVPARENTRLWAGEVSAALALNHVAAEEAKRFAGGGEYLVAISEAR